MIPIAIQVSRSKVKPIIHMLGKGGISVLQTSIFVGVMPLLELRIMEIHSFPHFSPTCFDILS